MQSMTSPRREVQVRDIMQGVSDWRVLDVKDIPNLKRSDARRRVGKLLSALSFDSFEEIVSRDMHTFLGSIRTGCSDVHNSVYVGCITYPIEHALTAGGGLRPDIHTPRRFIEDEEVGGVEECDGQAQALFHAEGELAHPFAARLDDLRRHLVSTE